MGRFTNYIKDTRAEFRHVTWLSQKQVAAYTGVVILVVVVVALYLFFFDTVFIRLLELLITR